MYLPLTILNAITVYKHVICNYKVLCYKSKVEGKGFIQYFKMGVLWIC